jgi:large subunit ribosomal protein L7Ae
MILDADPYPPLSFHSLYLSQPAKGKKPTKKVTKAAPVDKSNPLFPSRPKNFRVGGDLRLRQRDLSRYVRWPKYVRLQRQRKILMQRLKIPPALMQFRNTLDKNGAAELFKLLDKYKTEDKEAKAARLEAIAAKKAAGEPAESGPAPPTVKYGLKHVTTLIEQKKAKMVCIAHDVNPIELVVWLPALCRKMDVPFCIVKGKARLGVLTQKKNAAVVALTTVNPEDENKLKSLGDAYRAQFNNQIERKWGGGEMGLKTKAKMAKRAAFLAIEEAKKKPALNA